jgi:CBS domain-containing protein
VRSQEAVKSLLFAGAGKDRSVVQIARFLGEYPPFDALEERLVDAIAGRVQIAFFERGSNILERSGEPADHLYVVRTGLVELIDDGRVIDVLGAGESFGHPSLLSGQSPSLDVRAAEDTICYLVDPNDAAAVLATPGGLRFLSQSLRRRSVRALEGVAGDRADPWRAHVSSIVKRPPVTLGPQQSVSAAAELMSRERISSLLIWSEGSELGILTDRDLRSRVLGAGRSADVPISEVMTTPVVSVEPDATGAEVLSLMLERGVHHVPVVDRDGTLVGVVTDTDLLGLERTTPFHLRSAIERAPTSDAAIEAARSLPQAVRASVDGDVDPVDIGHMVAVVIDALTRRLIDLTISEAGDPPGPWAWIGLGSEARHEQALATDQDHALAYDAGDLAVDEVDAYFGKLAEAVESGLESAGIPRCKARVSATNPGWRGTPKTWAERFSGWIDDVSLEGSQLTAIAFDHRRVHGSLAIERTLAPIVGSVPSHPVFLRHVARTATENRPPTGFFRDFVVESDGEHAGLLDVKHGGLTLITSLARAHALAVGSTEIRTLGRLRAAVAAGRLEHEEAAALEESFRLLWQIRLEHQVRCAELGRPVDDFVDPSSLPPLTRHALKEAFRTIDRAQRSLAMTSGLRRR